MKRLALAVLLFLASVLPASAQEYFDIDVDLPQYPEMAPIPDSPVYYAPQVDANYFFYDGLYWDYYNDAWYSSPWYNGPWTFVDPVYVPTYILWVPIRFYHRPPAHWRGWRHDRAPRWSEHWGRDWQARHNQVFRGQRGGAVRAPLPEYQRAYNRGNYPRAPQQQNALHAQHYGYRPSEATVQQHYERRGITPAPQRVESPQRADVPQRSEPANPMGRGEARHGGDGRRDGVERERDRR